MGIKPQGVVHVGAHHGEEVAALRDTGVEAFLLIEGDPTTCTIAEQAHAADPDITVLNAIVADVAGDVTFHRASFDQSSSILAMKHHLDLHPGISQVQTVTAQATTLDAIMASQGARFADCNLLMIDVQGAELRVMKGAVSALDQFDAIACEVNITEVYEGCAQMEEIDAFLFDHGFLRVASAWEHSDSWGDALYVRSNMVNGLAQIDPVRRGAISMRDFGKNGRFANQLFQYAFMLIYALRAGCDIRLPDWDDGQTAFDLPQRKPPMPLPRVNLRHDRLAHHAFFHIPAMPRDIDFSGYFQGMPQACIQHRKFLRRCFSWTPDLQRVLEAWFNELTDNGTRPLVAAHLRRGDYTPFEEREENTPFVQIPTQWAFDELDRILDQHPDARIVVATDDDATRELAVARYGAWPMPENVDPKLADFDVLRRADILLGGNSSYAFFASLLAVHEQDARMVDFGSGSYVPFDPWAEQDFWSRHRGASLGMSAYHPGETTPERAQGVVTQLVSRADKSWLRGWGVYLAPALNTLQCEYAIVSAWIKRKRTRLRGLKPASFRAVRRACNRHWQNVRSGGQPLHLPPLRFMSSLQRVRARPDNSQ